MSQLWLVWLRLKHRARIADAKRRADAFVEEMGW